MEVLAPSRSGLSRGRTHDVALVSGPISWVSPFMLTVGGVREPVVNRDGRVPVEMAGSAAMTSVEQTGYPRFTRIISARELRETFTLTPDRR